MKGILLALQFFTVIPVRKELSLGHKEVTAMFVALPFIGGAIGSLMYAMFYLMHHVLDMGMLLSAVCIVLTGIVLTGGLHLDGWADTGDAFFSYRERDKRLDILEDPRLGAFGTMALIFLVLVKIALFHEVLLRDMGHIALFVSIPFMTRIGMVIYFASIQPAKNKGIAHFLKERLAGKQVILLSIICGIVLLVSLGYLLDNVIVPVSLFGILAIGVGFWRKWSIKHFGGVTGDLSGAFVEGMEAVIWLVVLLLL